MANPLGSESEVGEVPSPGPDGPSLEWPEYSALREALEDYLDHSPPNAVYSDVWRALATILGEYQRDAFIEMFELTRPAETACIRPLITGELSCPHNDADDDLPGPPHEPPGSDNAVLWLDEDGPAVYSMHVFPGRIQLLDADGDPRNRWFDLFDFAGRWGLEIAILPKSWFFLGSAVQVILYAPERYR